MCHTCGKRDRAQKKSLNSQFYCVCNELGCNNCIGGLQENPVTLKYPKLPDCSWAQKMRLKQCSSFVQFKKWQVWVLLYKTQSGRRTAQIWPSPNQNWSESHCSCIIQEPLTRDKYIYMGLFVKYALRKNCCVSKILPGQQKNLRITVVVLLSTLQQTALLLEKFCLCLHCYTLQ